MSSEIRRAAKGGSQYVGISAAGDSFAHLLALPILVGFTVLSGMKVFHDHQGMTVHLFAVSLKPDLFEGLKFDFSKPLNMNFAVTHRQAQAGPSNCYSIIDLHAQQSTCCYSIYMGNIEMPMGSPGATLKVPVGTYEFGANLISSRVSLTASAELSGKSEWQVQHCSMLSNLLHAG